MPNKASVDLFYLPDTPTKGKFHLFHPPDTTNITHFCCACFRLITLLRSLLMRIVNTVLAVECCAASVPLESCFVVSAGSE